MNPLDGHHEMTAELLGVGFESQLKALGKGRQELVDISWGDLGVAGVRR